MKNKTMILLAIIFFINTNAQESRTIFGLQYKPIIPSEYFNSSYIQKTFNNHTIKLNPRYSNSFGMIIRHKINKTFSIESGLNYIQRNYRLEMHTLTINFEDFSDFPIRSYEVPLQLLTYVRIYKFYYLNVSFGVSHNIIASDVFSFGNGTEEYFQNTYRKNGGYRALLANIGVEYRKDRQGNYYLGTTLHRPWGEIGRVYPEYTHENNSFNHLVSFNEKAFLEILGSFLTLDFRYFFGE